MAGVSLRHRLLHPLFAAYRRVEHGWYRRWPASARRLGLPDFLGIGAQKAGTTWLHENLRHHPGVFVPSGKEMHHFDHEFGRSLRSYANLFKAGAGRAKGEITPAYGNLSAERIRYIHSVMPEVRLILLLRHPVDRAWSQAAMELATLYGLQIEDVPETRLKEFLAAAPCTERSDYLAILENWLSVVRREQLFVGFFDDIWQRPRGLLHDVFVHIGVSCDVDWDSFPLTKRILPDVGPDSQKHGFARTMETSDPTRQGYHRIPMHIREWLEHRYRDQLVRLAERFGEPCTQWLRR